MLNPQAFLPLLSVLIQAQMLHFGQSDDRHFASKFVEGQHSPRPVARRVFRKMMSSSARMMSLVRGQGQRLLIRRTLVSRTLALRQDLPYHLVVGLPALSPTMDSGALAEWYLQEGDSFAAGEAIAKIETDKAAMDFEAQDDGFVAKILVAAGQGNDSK
jgi:acetyl/propionyl-CoA carboxylase alpha subunit